MALFTIENLTFTYPAGKKAALNDINLTVNSGEFTIICGRSGSGKSTLLRHLKTALTPLGETRGRVLFCGRALENVPQREQAEKIGFVMQNPDNQIVTDKVWHELAFGLESLGYAGETVRLRTAETASFFGIQKWFNEDVRTLSGGQKQLLNLASVTAMQPEVLLLDEPTSRLDPIAAGEFLEAVKRINRELGTTVIMTEHRLEDVFSYADKIIVMEEGRIAACGRPDEAAEKLAENGGKLASVMPVPMMVYAELAPCGIGSEFPCPADVRSGRMWLSQVFGGKQPEITELPFQGKSGGSAGTQSAGSCMQSAGFEADEMNRKGRKPLVQLKDLWFRYEKNGNDIIKDCALEVHGGELFAIVGGNGAGKSTLLCIIAGLRKPYRGKVRINGSAPLRIALLPQDPQTVFAESSVRKDLMRAAQDSETRMLEIAALTELNDLLDMHPYDLSGGEQQKAALAKLLLSEPDIILLDEPTKGIDGYFKKQFAEILRKLCRQGKTVIMVSHDTEFCAEYADRCAMMFDGRIMAEAPPREFFSGNSFYTTAANRMSRHIFKNAVTANDVAELVRANFGENPPHSGGENGSGIDGECGSCGDAEREVQIRLANPLRAVTGITASALALAAAFAGVLLLNDRRYYIVSFAIVILAAASFCLSFEKSKPRTGEIMIIAVLTAIAAAGRAIFFMTPNFKPTSAVTVIAGMYLGPQTGFLVGAMSGFVSDFFFGQGPWTPWQMCAFGMVGFIAGIFGKSRKLRESRIAVVILGTFLTFFIYGGIVDLWTVLGFYEEPSLAAAAVVYAGALPFNMIHAASSAIFLYFLTDPMREKLARIKLKYGFGFAR